MAPGINHETECYNSKVLLEETVSKWESIYKQLGFHLLDKEAAAPLIDLVLSLKSNKAKTAFI